MKTTIEIPDAVFRRAKSLASSRGITLKRFFTDAVEHQMRRYLTGANSDLSGPHTPSDPPWMVGFGELADLGEEHRMVLDAVEDEFERLAPDDIS